MKLKLVKRWVFPQFPRSLEVNPAYYLKGKRLPKILGDQLKRNELIYTTVRKKDYLSYLTGERLRKPNGIPLNGQALYSGIINEFDRAKLVIKLKEYFGELLATPKQFPLLLRSIFLCPEDKIGDLDNIRGFYDKVFIDAMKNKGHKTTRGETIYFNYKGRPLPDDSVKYLSGLNQLWYPTEKECLVFELYEWQDFTDERQKIISTIFEQTGLEL